MVEETIETEFREQSLLNLIMYYHHLLKYDNRINTIIFRISKKNEKIYICSWLCVCNAHVCVCVCERRIERENGKNKKVYILPLLFSKF